MTAQTDRELLELAAKAAGLDAQYSENMGDFSIGEPYSRGEVRWNPLTNDGDALRLAVELDLLWDRDVHYTKFLDMTDQNLLRATRRAIVRAAAALTQGA